MSTRQYRMRLMYLYDEQRNGEQIHKHPQKVFIVNEVREPVQWANEGANEQETPKTMSGDEKIENEVKNNAEWRKL